MRKPNFAYCAYSETIRFFPHNSLVSVNVAARWLTDCDHSIIMSSRIDIFKIISDGTYDTQEVLVRQLNHSIDVVKTVHGDFKL